jgi:CubicO group peptidase (beta-lactamase class C family)
MTPILLASVIRGTSFSVVKRWVLTPSRRRFHIMNSRSLKAIHSNPFTGWRLLRIPCISLVTVLVLSVTTGFSQKKPEDSAPEKLEAEILALMKEWHIPGMSISVITDGDILWHRGLGVRNVQTKEPVDDHTIFHAASMSKPVFAYAVLKMSDEGFLNLDTPLVKYAPKKYIEETFLGHSMDIDGFKKEHFSRITARMALSHSSGLQHFGLKKPVEMLFEPGKDFYYSSNGIEYLRYIIEHLKGSRIDTLMAEYVFKPLDMKYSSFLWRDQYESNSAAGHDKYGATSGSIYRYPLPTAQAGLYTNAPDYGRFLLALLKGEGLKEETYNEMVTPQIETNPDVYWGLGFGIELVSGGKGIWHWGDAGTHTGFFHIDLDHESGFVYFVNGFYGLAIVEDVLALLSEGEHPALSFTLGSWSFRDDYLSASMEFQNKYFNGQRDIAHAFYRQVASEHEKGMRFIDEVLLQYWATDLLQGEKISDAVSILQLLIDAYYAERSDTCRVLEQKYHKTGTDDAAVDYLKSVGDIIEDVHFHWTNVQFAWIMENTIADLRPAILDEKILLSYAGSFDPLRVDYEDGGLFLYSKERGKLKMIPMNESTFMLEEIDHFRIQMVKEDGGVVGAKRIWSGGETEMFQKTQ